MRLVVQRVTKARVVVKGKSVGEIDKGLFILLGVGQDDTHDDAEKLARKILSLRIMSDKNDKMNLCVKDIEGQILVVSQFTLLADTKKGNRPSFIKSAPPKIAKNLYQHFVKTLRRSEVQVETGEFGAYMKISAELDGPVTILFDSKD